VSKKIYIGKVISNKMDKTVVVAITRLFQHPVYKKTVKRVTKLKAHDEQNKCNVGDTVKIIESRPQSKEKRWVVLD
jgi:small subunit ribosomal protein S17